MQGIHAQFHAWLDERLLLQCTRLVNQYRKPLLTFHCEQSEANILSLVFRERYSALSHGTLLYIGGPDVL